MKFNFQLLILFLFLSNYGIGQDIYIPYKIGGKWGISDTSHNIAIKPSYDRVFISKDGFLIVEENNKSGIVTFKNEVILESKFLYFLRKGKFIIAARGKNEELYTLEGESILKNGHSLEKVINDSLVIVKVFKDKFGLLNINSENTKAWLTDTTFISLTYDEGKLTGVKNDTLFLFNVGEENKVINKSAELIEEKTTIANVKSESDTLVPRKIYFSYRLKKAKIQDRQYLVLQVSKTKTKENNNRVVSCDTFPESYNSIQILNNPSKSYSEYEKRLTDEKNTILYNMAIVSDSSNLKGLIDGEGHKILDCIYEDIKPHYLMYKNDPSKHNRLYICSKNGKWGVVDKNNQTIISFNFESIKARRSTLNYEVSEGIICSLDGKYGIMNLENKVVIPFEMDDIEKAGPLHKNSRNKYRQFFRLEKNNKFGAYDGQNYCEPTYKEKWFHVKYFYSYPTIEFRKKRELIGYGDFHGRRFYKE